MAQIRINSVLLLDALEDHSAMAKHFLDREISDVLSVFDELEVGKLEGDDAAARIDAEPDRYLAIDPIPPRDGFRIMETFVEALPDSEGKRLLQKALTWKKPFSNFRDALDDFPEIRKQWFAFHEKAVTEWVSRWLEEEGIEHIICQ